MTKLTGRPSVPPGTPISGRLLWAIPLQGGARGASPKHLDFTFDWGENRYEVAGGAELDFPHPRKGENDQALRGPLVAVLTIGADPNTQTARYPLTPYETSPGYVDLTLDPEPAVVVAAQSLLELIGQTEALLPQMRAAYERADTAAERAERSAFDWEGEWAPGFYERGSVVSHLGALWRAAENTDSEPLSSNPLWDLLVPQGKQGLPGVPGTVNGINASQLSLYTGDAVPHSEAPPSSWPLGVRTFDVRNGLAQAYPFAQATLTSRAAADGLVQQEALVVESTRDGLITTLWLRSSVDASSWRPWRKGTGGDDLNVERFSAASRVINGSGELGTTGWTRYGGTVSFWGGYDDVFSGLVLEYYRHNAENSWPALTQHTGVYQDLEYLDVTGQLYITVDAVAISNGARFAAHCFPVGGGAAFSSIDEALKPGINTFGPFGARAGGYIGRVSLQLYHPAGTVNNFGSRFRIAVAQTQSVLPGDTRRSVRHIFDTLTALNTDYQAFKQTPATAQLAENSRGAGSLPTAYPEGLSYLPTTGSGWPFAGVVETVRPKTASSAAATRQTIRQTGGAGIQHRTALADNSGWSAWTAYAEKGTRGTKWHRGAGHPKDNVTLTDVLVGDYYLEIISGDVYVRETSAWTAAPIGNTKGATGVSSYTRERRTGGTPGCLHVLINGVWQVASPSNSKLELDSWGVLGADNVMYGPGAEAVVDGLGFLAGKNYYLGYPLNGKNLFPFDNVVPVDALPSQAQRMFVPCSTPRGVSNRLFLNPAAEPIDVEPVAQVYRVTPLSFPFETDLGPAGLNEMIRNIDQPATGQTTSGALSLRVVQDGNTGFTGQNTVGQPSPHVDGSGRALFLRDFQFTNTFHATTWTDWPETDDGELLVALQHSNVPLGKPGVQLVSTGDHTAPSLYYAELTGTQIGLRRRTTVNGVISDVALGVYVARPAANYQIMLIRARKQGGNIKVKAWVAPAGWHLAGANLQEPAAWDLERTDTTITGSGRWGPMQRHDHTRIHAASLATLDGAASF